MALLACPGYRSFYSDTRATTFFELKVRVFLRGHPLGDADKFLSSCMDALEGQGGLWANDRQVSKATVERIYHAKKPRIEVEVAEFVSQQLPDAADIRGIMPNLTGGKPSEQYLKERWRRENKI